VGTNLSWLGPPPLPPALLAANAVLVRFFYRGPEMTQIASGESDIPLIADGRLQEDAMRRLRINAGELIAKAHERGFASLDEVESAVLYPNGTIYLRGREAASDAARHRELLERLDALGAQLAALRR
jgi:uncharacterized membrane protein YcaP (DUF421 family)